MTDRSDQGRSRNLFWVGLLAGIVIGVAGLFLASWALWDPPF